ncbi:MAG: hypothetical protein MJZ00_05635 [Paludibacteraceae bacterium]|nr:hypothetical protein [Paludibacteraceae bacterium]
MKFYLVAVCFLVSLVAVSQEKSPHSQSMGSISIYDDYHANCSLTSLLEQTEVCLGYHNSFFLSDLGETTLHAAFPTSKFTHSYTASAFGYAHYNDIFVSAGLSRLLTPRMAAGLSATYILHHHAGTSDAMHGFRISPGVYCYFAEDNLLAAYAKIGSEPISLDKTKLGYSAFLAYSLVINTFSEWAVELGTEHNTFVGKTGFCYNVERISFRCGMSLMPIRPSAGIGFEIDCFSIFYAADYCNTLGTSMSLGFKWKIQNKRRDAK